MSPIEQIKKVIIEKCKEKIDELSGILIDELSDPDMLKEAWNELRADKNLKKFNHVLRYIVTNISDFTNISSDDFIFIHKVRKSSLNAKSIPFYDQTSSTCLLYVDQGLEIFDVDIPVLSKIILNNFESILSLTIDEVAIFQKKCSDIICLEDKVTYSTALLTNIGISINDDTVVTSNKFIKAKHVACKKNYVQYKDVLDILNKYSNTTDILWKYLLLYQIIENFSYRRSISKSLRESSTLNVKHLSSVLTSSKGEGDQIKASIKQFLLDITDCIYFTHNEANGTIVSLKLVTVSTTTKIILDNIEANVGDIAEFLNIKLLKIATKEVSGAEIGEIIYTVRNCIVHNKETEWIHINHSLLKEQPEIKTFFEKFLLPTLEFIVKELIFKENTIVDYPHDKPNYIVIWGNASTPIPTSSATEIDSVMETEISLYKKFQLFCTKVKNCICS